MTEATETAPVTEPMTPSLANQPEARTETGEIKDQSQSTTTTHTDTEKPETEQTETKPASTVPEKYEFKAPEGVQLSDSAIEAASTVFKDLGLTQDAAQKLVDFHTSQIQAIQNEATSTYNKLRDEWRGEILKDSSLATNGDLKPEVKAAFSKVIDSLGATESKAFREALNLTGVGDNPAFIRGFYKLAERFTEGTPVNGNSPSPLGQSRNGAVKPSAAQAMYPNLPSSNG